MTQTPEVCALLLSAGLGFRLKPLTDDWPKCLMPIGDRPLLEYWLQTIRLSNINHVLVNLHHHADLVSAFLQRPRFIKWVDCVYEPQLLGTAGTLSNNKAFFQGKTILLVHADNWCQCDFNAFIAYHLYQRPKSCPITMMSFDTTTPESCGVLETDARGVVVGFHEKVSNPPTHRANGAVYLLEPEVLDWITQHPEINDFSTQVLPNYIGRIATWYNPDIHKDIGTLSALYQAQSDPLPRTYWSGSDAWHEQFMSNKIHQAITDAYTASELIAGS